MPSQIDNLLVVGGGRWAKVLAGVANDLLGATSLIRMHTAHNAVAVRDWITQRGWDDRFEVQSDWPPAVPAGTAVIVANAAADHERATRWALAERLPVLVEKPFTLCAATTRDLIRLADSTGEKLAAAHVLLFASHLDRLERAAPPTHELQSLRIDWADAAGEQRGGELKQYDAAVPVYADVLPHVVSILRRFAAARPEFVALTAERGGARVRLRLLLGSIECDVTLEREAESRRRSIDLRGATRTVRLDFATEPGVLSDGATQCCADPDWASGPKPVARMLGSFFEWVHSGTRDARLSCASALAANELMDEIHAPYRAAVASWLAQASRVAPDIRALRYCVNEILRRRLRPSSEQIEHVLQQLQSGPCKRLEVHAWRELLDGADAESWMKSIGLTGYTTARIGS